RPSPRSRRSSRRRPRRHSSTDPMRSSVFAALAIGLASLSAPVSAVAQAVPEIPFDANVDFLKFPSTLPWGEVAGVGFDSRRHLFAYVRTGAINTLHAQTAASLYEFGPDGTFIREIGKGLYG